MNTEIQRSLITKFRKTIYRKVVKAIETYNLIEPNDKIAVCISGGKDSMLLAICNEYGLFLTMKDRCFRKLYFTYLCLVQCIIYNSLYL